MPESSLTTFPGASTSHSSIIPSFHHSTPGSLLSQPYGALALHYDTVMAHVDYPGWARHLRGLWRTVRGRTTKPRRVLELAAGTCRLAEHPLFPDALTVQTDLSPAMLRTASAPPTHPSSASGVLRRAACDMRALPFRNAAAGLERNAIPDRNETSREQGFDLVVMVYDSLNYMTRPEDVRRAFDEVLRVLAPGGVFLFDVTTATCSRRHFADALDFQETEAGALVRTSRYDAASRTQLNLFTFFTEGPDGRYDRAEEVHRQRIWPAAMLKKTAREAGFSVRACLADFTLKPGTDRHERLHFILQRPVKDS